MLDPWGVSKPLDPQPPSSHLELNSPAQVWYPPSSGAEIFGANLVRMCLCVGNSPHNSRSDFGYSSAEGPVCLSGEE